MASSFRFALGYAALASAVGCGSSAAPQTVSPDAAGTGTERPLADYVHDLSERNPGVTADTALLEHHAIPTTDGTILDGWVRRPEHIGPLPIVLVFTPYYGGGDPSLLGSVFGDPSFPFARYLIPRGYAVGFVSVGGTGNSGGCFRDGGPIERRQLADAVQYFAGQPWSNGAVGAIGVSYDGTTANELFVEAPPALKTVVPMEAITDYYRYSYNNGIVREDTPFFTTYYYAIVGLSPAGLSGGIGPMEPEGYVRQLSGELCPEQLEIQRESVQGGLLVDKTPYWHERDAIELIRNSLDKARPSMFFIQGYQDSNVDPQMADGFLETVAATGVPLHVWFGQWMHSYPEMESCAIGDPCRNDFYEIALLAWFDQFLKGRNTGILDAPAVQSQADDGLWRHEENWPPAFAQLQDRFPRVDNALDASPASGSLSYVDQGPSQTIGIALSGTSIEFVSAPLQAPLRLTGLPQLETLATADGFRANLVATLLARKPDGRQRYVNFAAINLNHAETLDQGDPDITGKPLRVHVNFFPQDNVIAAGDRLVLHIAGDVTLEHTSDGGGGLLNYGPSLLPTGAGARVTLDLGATRLRLPVNPGNRLEPASWL